MNTGSGMIVGDVLDVLKGLPTGSHHMAVTSPPFWKRRDYGVVGQLGLESTLGEYIHRLALIFAEVKRVLTPTGSLWLNMGDRTVNGDKFAAVSTRRRKRPVRNKPQTQYSG
jgi:site-specific DNA-methyltransferase (adenine-specific)